jgi:hypothetical protein
MAKVSATSGNKILVFTMLSSIIDSDEPKNCGLCPNRQYFVRGEASHIHVKRMAIRMSENNRGIRSFEIPLRSQELLYLNPESRAASRSHPRVLQVRTAAR